MRDIYCSFLEMHKDLEGLAKLGSGEKNYITSRIRWEIM